MTDEQSSENEVDPLSLFPEEWQQAVTGLAYLGQLTEEVNFCGHHFVLRTLLPQDKFAIANVMQTYRNTVLEVDVFQAAHVAAALVSIDHDDNFCTAIGPELEATIRGRFNWITQNLYLPTIEYLWTNYALLEAKALRAMQELDRLSKGSQPITSQPWLDSLTDAGSSPDETNSDTPHSTPSN